MELKGDMIKDIGLRTLVHDAYPTQIVGDAWEGSFTAPTEDFVALNHVVPAGMQLKILFLRSSSSGSGPRKQPGQGST